MNLQDTIVAQATGNVVAALGIIRLSGKNAINIISKVFVPASKQNFLNIVKANTLYYGTIYNTQDVLIKSQNNLSITDKDCSKSQSNSEQIQSDKKNILKENIYNNPIQSTIPIAIDEVVVSVFKSPHSFTGEDIVEISHHGSLYIQQEILQTLLNNGARLADRGEFSLRAFINGKMNLSQAEAVADLIASDNKASHDLAMKQLRGSYDKELKDLRQRFLKIASLLELEIDFSAEQEVFVDRNKLLEELNNTEKILENLVDSYSQGNAFKNGLPVAIAGKPNSGKSTLMNAILKDDRSIVSAVQGTTRDTIEETININGISIRFIDTAGIRESDNEIEKEGIKRSFKAIEKAKIVLYLIDSSQDDMQSVEYQLKFLQQDVDMSDKRLILVVNKEDISNLSVKDKEALQNKNAIFISAKQSKGIDKILDTITEDLDARDISQKVFVTNIRHYNALKNTLQEILTAKEAVCNDVSSDLVSENIRSAMQYLGEITGEITTEDVLINIFSSFCIGK